ncbi:uncharacterized protein DS421_5g161820 [Arachis hypogaea]|nr:uncharacterized protein DS421_5g161820 [Arachis hypogaea]
MKDGFLKYISAALCKEIKLFGVGNMWTIISLGPFRYRRFYFKSFIVLRDKLILSLVLDREIFFLPTSYKLGMFVYSWLY